MMKKFYAEITGVIVFIVYLFTMAPSVIQIDSGELAAVQASLGIAHPTGYPLFTMIGYLFLQVPVGTSKIFMSNLLAAIYCAVAVIFLIRMFKVLLDKIIISLPTKKAKGTHKKNMGFKEVKPEAKEKSTEGEKILASAAAGLLIAFSKTFWFQSTSVEVYSLHLLLISLVLFSLVKAYYADLGSIKKSSIKNWLLTAFFLALSFSNHMTTLLVLPGTAYLFFKKERFSSESFKKIFYMLLLFFPILAVIYSYLPIRASANPLINWGNPIDFEKFLRHFAGKQYQVWLFTSTDSAKKQLEYFFTNLPIEFFYIGLLIVIIGIFACFKYNKTAFVFASILFISTVAYSINYDINDIDSYFLLAFIALGIFAAFAFYAISITLRRKSFELPVSAALFIIIIAVQTYGNFNKVNQDDVYIFEDYTKSLLNSVEENSIILSYQWDYFLSQSYYFQFVEDYRRDVAVIDKELLRRSWYFNQLTNCYPGILNGLENEIKIFQQALKPFERDENYDANVLETYYRMIMTGLVSENIEDKSFYIGPELIDNEMRSGQFILPEGYTIVPHLFLFKVTKSNEYVPAPDPEFEIRIPQTTNFYSEFILNLIGRMLSSRAMYELQQGKTDRAILYVNKIRMEIPNFILPVSIRDLN